MRLKEIFLLFPLLFSVSLFSCSKETDTTPTPEPELNSEPKSEFLVHGVSDVTFDNWVGAAMGLSVEYVSGAQKTATISLGEMPAGVTYEIRPESGTPTFGSSVLFKTTGESIGTHAANLTVSNGSVTKDYNFNIHLGDTKCNDGFTGYYDELYMYCFGPIIRFVSVEQYSENPNRVSLSFKSSWDSDDILLSFYIDLNCGTKEIIVPTQQTQLGEISGSGYFDAQTYVITLPALKLVGADGSISDCSVYFNLKK